MRKFLAAFVAAFLMFAVVGSVATAATSEPAKAYGGCVSKSTGYLRILEKANLAKSAVGACKKTETKIVLPSATGLSPSKLVFVRAVSTGTATETCARKGATSSTWTFSCTTVVVAPSPSPAS
jgi:hypothetical protein